MANQEGQVIEQLGPKCLISTGDYSQGVGGRESAAIKMTNDSGERCTFKHLESGLTRLESEGNLEVIAGEKSSEGPTIRVITPHGDIDFKVEEGFFKVKATNICFEAEDSIVMKAAKMQIGDEKQTQQIVIAAQKVEMKAKKGSLAAALKTDSMLTTFAGSFVSDKVEELIGAVAGKPGGGSC